MMLLAGLVGGEGERERIRGRDGGREGGIELVVEREGGVEGRRVVG